MADALEKSGAYLFNRSDLKAAIGQHQKALAIRRKLYGENHLKVAESLLKLGDIYIVSRQFADAFLHHQEALKIREEIYRDTQHLDLAYSLQQTGFLFFSKGDYNTASEYYRKALAIYQGSGKMENAGLATLYYYQAIIHIDKSSYHLGLADGIRALNIYQKLENPGFINLSNVYNCIATAHMRMGSYEEAVRYFNKVLELISLHQKEDKLESAHYYANIAITYNKLEDYSRALDYFFKTLRLQQNGLPSGHPEIDQTKSNIANMYSEMGEFDKAISYFSQLGWNQNTGHPNLNASKFNFNLGNLYARQGDYEKALGYFQKSLYQNVPDFNNHQELLAQPPLNRPLDPFTFLASLKEKGICLIQIGKSKQSLRHLRAANEVLQLCDSLIDITRRSLILPEDRMNFNQASLEAYEASIELSLELFDYTLDTLYLKQAFRYSEKSKSNVLRQTLSEEQALNYDGLPDAILQKERQLKLEIQRCLKNLGHFQAANNPQAVQQFSGQLSELEKARQELIDGLQKDFPAYYNLKFDNSVISLAAVQEKLLAENSALIEFFIGEKATYRFTITKESIALDRLDFDDFLMNDYGHYQKLVSDYQFINHSDSVHIAYHFFVEAYHDLYQKFMKTAAVMQDERIERLIIVPDRLLNYIPFDLMIRELPEKGEKLNYARLNYLLYDYSISYAFSASLLEQNIKMSDKSYTYSYIGYAPTYRSEELSGEKNRSYARLTSNRDYSNLAELPNAQKSVMALAKAFGGISYTGPEATEDNFKKTFESSAVLDLAMHGVLNDQHPMYSHLVFTPHPDSQEDNLLNAYELYNMSFNVGLIILGACNTGVGRLRLGEGIMSLTRAFTYAKCPSIVMSLWSLPDTETSKITVDFVEELAKGKNKR